MMPLLSFAKLPSCGWGFDLPVRLQLMHSLRQLQAERDAPAQLRKAALLRVGLYIKAHELDSESHSGGDIQV